jgi:hypothetical protein
MLQTEKSDGALRGTELSHCRNIFNLPIHRSRRGLTKARADEAAQGEAQVHFAQNHRASGYLFARSNLTRLFQAAALFYILRLTFSVCANPGKTKMSAVMLDSKNER